MKKFIAVSFDEKEYMYRPKTAHAVPIKNAALICNLLNQSRYMLNNGEKWHVYSSGGGQVYAKSQRFSIRSGSLVRITNYTN